MKATFPFISSHHLKTCTAPLALKCTPQTQSHLQFTPFYLAGSLGLPTDVLPTQPFNMILSAHCVFSQHNTKRQVQLCSLKFTRFFNFCWRYWINRMYVGTTWPTSVMRASPVLCLTGGKAISSQLLPGSLCPYHSSCVSSNATQVPVTKTFPIPTLEPRELETSLRDTSIHPPTPPIHPFPKYYHIQGIGNPKLIKI